MAMDRKDFLEKLGEFCTTLDEAEEGLQELFEANEKVFEEIAYCKDGYGNLRLINELGNVSLRLLDMWSKLGEVSNETL